LESQPNWSALYRKGFVTITRSERFLQLAPNLVALANEPRTRAQHKVTKMSINMTEEQLQRIIAALAPASKKGSFAQCNATYDGSGGSETVETFISAVNVYKKLEDIEDENALEGLTLLLKGDAAIWWEGSKSEVKTWTKFQERIRHAFAPKTPAYILYQEIIGKKQDASTPTEKFIARKRALIAQLPAPAPTESQQIHMVYGQLHLRIRERVPRSAINSFEDLLRLTRSAEEILLEKEPCRVENSERVPKVGLRETFHRLRCEFCKKSGHGEEECRLKKLQQQARSTAGGDVSTKTPLPEIACYGCGKSGVVRSKCPDCCKEYPQPGNQHTCENIEIATLDVEKVSYVQEENTTCKNDAFEYVFIQGESKNINACLQSPVLKRFCSVPKLTPIPDSLSKAQEKSEERRKETAERKRREGQIFQPGDLVKVTSDTTNSSSRGVTAKLAPRRDGPYVILQRHGPASYEVKRNKEKVGFCHTSALTPYYGDIISPPEPLQPIIKRGRPKKQANGQAPQTVDVLPNPVSSPGRRRSQRGRL
jgi:hypothetical protein